MDSSVAKCSTRVVHLKRKNGKVIQNCDVYIGRRCTFGGWDLQESIWANKFRLSNDQYEKHVLNNPKLMAALPQLKNKKLGCWCKPKSCHGDVLVALVKKFLAEPPPANNISDLKKCEALQDGKEIESVERKRD